METSEDFNGNPVSGLYANMSDALHLEISAMCKQHGWRLSVTHGDEHAEYGFWTVWSDEFGLICNEVSRSHCYYILKGVTIGLMMHKAKENQFV